MEEQRIVWVDTSRDDQRVLCLSRSEHPVVAASEGRKPMAEVAVVIGKGGTKSLHAEVEDEVESRFMYVMACLDDELLAHALPLVREGYRIV